MQTARPRWPGVTATCHALNRLRAAPMQFDYTADQRAFRDRLCAFLGAELTEAARREQHDPDQLGGWSVPFSRAFHRRLGAAGFIGLSWPSEYGGQGKSPAFDSIVVRELEYHRAPNLDSGTISYLAPSI